MGKMGKTNFSQQPENGRLNQKEEGIHLSIAIQKIVTDSFAMRYFRFGTGGRTMVILPGLSIKSVMDSASAVAFEYAVMKNDFTVYVFDRRENLPARYPVYEMARDTAAAIRSLGLKDIYLFGASQGGMIAQVIAIEYPDLVKKLALGSTVCRLPENGVLDRWTALARERNGEELFFDFLRAIYPPDEFEKYRNVVGMAARMVTEEDFARFVILAEGSDGFDVSERLKEIQCPVLAIGSEDDAVLGGEGTREIVRQLGDRPDVASYMYEGYGHAAFDTAPDYRKRLYRFFME